MHSRWMADENLRPSKLFHNSHEYTIKDSTLNNHVYRCTHFRSAKCKARVSMNRQTGAIRAGEQEHTCRRLIHGSAVFDVSDEMRTRAVELASDLGKTSNAIWNQCRQEALSQHGSGVTSILLGRSELMNLVLNVRDTVFPSDYIVQ